MGNHSHTCHTCYCSTNFIGIGFNTEMIDISHAVVEAAFIPKAFFRTADTAVARLNRKGNAAVPAHSRTSVVSSRPLAAHLVQAETFASGIIVPFFNELASVEMRTAIALIVNALSVEHFWPALSIQFWQAVESQHVCDDTSHDFGDRWTARYLDNGLICNDFVYRRGSRWVRLGRLHTTPRSAGTP